MKQLHDSTSDEYFDLRDDYQRPFQYAGILVDALYSAGEYQLAEDLDAVLEEAIEWACAGMGQIDEESKDSEDKQYAVDAENFEERVEGDRSALTLRIGVGYK